MIATESEFAPFEFKILIDAKDSFVGADIELENAIADTLGVDVDFSLMSFNNVLASVTLTMRLKMLSSSKNRTRQPIPHLKVWQEKQLVRKKVQSKKTLRKTNCQIRASFP